MNRRRDIRSKLAPALLALAAVSCTTDLEARGPQVVEEPWPVLVSRTGVPVLMDLPVVGFLFGRTTIVR